MAADLKWTEGHTLGVFALPSWYGNLCVVQCLDEYLARTKLIRENSCADIEEEPLIISYAEPFGPVKSATVARYVKLFLGEAGIDISVFTAHSTRSASTSLGNNLGMSFKDIAKAAGWRRESTF